MCICGIWSSGHESDTPTAEGSADDHRNNNSTNKQNCRNNYEGDDDNHNDDNDNNDNDDNDNTDIILSLDIQV